MKPTNELRFEEREIPWGIIAGHRRVFVLRQRWVSDSGDSHEWRDVPTVRLPPEAN